ncbi:hypothetical protein QY95_01820 [Bacillus thermotolerans]|uniref:Uncharacterized protein n=1 Tax=Bacillus thermotolerans TaxID=1221996 RepID=A0A0F5I4X6_BACTR|nr:hypothetical protein QY95_01820 [Bacillus thermotolerans]
MIDLLGLPFLQPAEKGLAFLSFLSNNAARITSHAARKEQLWIIHYLSL